MLERAVFQQFVLDNLGNIQPNAQVTVRNASDDSIADIYESLTATSTKSNPFNVGSSALARFYAAPGRYNIRFWKDGKEANLENVEISSKAHRLDLNKSTGAELVAYDPITSGLNVFDVQGAIDKIAAGKIFVTVKDFGGTADGVQDDTNSLQAAFDTGLPVIIDSPVAISDTVNISSYLHCVNGGKIVYTGPETNPTKTVALLTSGKFGFIELDGSNKEVKLLVCSTGSEHHGDKILTRNVQASDSAKNLSAGLIVDGGSKVYCPSVLSIDMPNAGHSNDSFPQSVVVGDNSSLIGEVAYSENCASHLVTAGAVGSTTPEIKFADQYYINGNDNGIYCLQGRVEIGRQFYDSDIGEPYVNRSALVIGEQYVRGNCIATGRVEDAEFTSVGKIVGLPRGESANADNCPRGFLSHRPGNTLNGEIKIGNVSGDFANLLVRTDFTDTTRFLSIDSVNVNLHFRKSDSGWESTNWFNLAGVNQFNIGSVRVRAIDQEDAITTDPSDYLTDSIYTDKLNQPSYIKSMDVTIHGSDGSISANGVYRGQRQSDLFTVLDGAVWQTNNPTAYRRQSNLAEKGTTINDEPPQSGYWLKGTLIRNNNFGDDAGISPNQYGWIKTTSSDVQDWQVVYVNTTLYAKWKGTLDAGGLSNVAVENINCNSLLALSSGVYQIAGLPTLTPDTVIINAYDPNNNTDLIQCAPQVSVSNTQNAMSFRIFRNGAQISGATAANLRIHIYISQDIFR